MPQFDSDNELEKKKNQLNVDDSVCDVCDDDESEEINPIIFCEGCDIAVHKDCYLVEKVPEGDWFCRSCEYQKSKGIALKRQRCRLCFGRGGALLPSSDPSLWVHSFCAIRVYELFMNTSPKTGFVKSAYNKPIIVENLEAAIKKRHTKVCCLCKRRLGACVQCQGPGCRETVHPYCARSHSSWKEGVRESQDDVLYFQFCPKHNKNINKTISLLEDESFQEPASSPPTSPAPTPKPSTPKPSTTTASSTSASTSASSSTTAVTSTPTATKPAQSSTTPTRPNSTANVSTRQSATPTTTAATTTAATTTAAAAVPSSSTTPESASSATASTIKQTPQPAKPAIPAPASTPIPASATTSASKPATTPATTPNKAVTTTTTTTATTPTTTTTTTTPTTNPQSISSSAIKSKLTTAPTTSAATPTTATLTTTTTTPTTATPTPTTTTPTTTPTTTSAKPSTTTATPHQPTPTPTISATTSATTAQRTLPTPADILRNRLNTPSQTPVAAVAAAVAAAAAAPSSGGSPNVAPIARPLTPTTSATATTTPTTTAKTTTPTPLQAHGVSVAVTPVTPTPTTASTAPSTSATTATSATTPQRIPTLLSMHINASKAPKPDSPVVAVAAAPKHTPLQKLQQQQLQQQQIQQQQIQQQQLNQLLQLQLAASSSAVAGGGGGGGNGSGSGGGGGGGGVASSGPSSSPQPKQPSPTQPRKRDPSPHGSPTSKAKVRKTGSGTDVKTSEPDVPAQMKRILDIVDGFRKSKVLFTACELGLFDILAAKGPLSATQIAVEVKSDPDRIARLMDACVSLDLLTKRTAATRTQVPGPQGVYANAQLARLFLSDNSPFPLKEHVICNDLVDFPLWSHLLPVVKDGEGAVNATFGLAREEHVLDAVFDTDTLRDRFINSQDVLARVSAQHIVATVDMARFLPAGQAQHRIVEIGNLAGQLSLAAMERFSNLKATIISRLLTDTTTHAPELLSRVQFVHGNSLDINQIPVADIFVLTGVLPPLPQDKAFTLLRRVRQCLPAHGALLLQEKVLRANAHSVSTHVQDLNALVRSSAGRCRRLEDIEHDLTACGFVRIELIHTHLSVDVVLAYPDTMQ